MIRKNLHQIFFQVFVLIWILDLPNLNAQTVDTTNTFVPPLTGTHLIYAEVVFHDVDGDGNFDASFNLSGREITVWDDYLTSVAFYDEGIEIRDGGGFAKTNVIVPVSEEVTKIWIAVDVANRTYRVWIQTEASSHPVPVLDKDATFRNSEDLEINRWAALHNAASEPDYLTVDSVALTTSSDPTLDSITSSIGNLDPEFSPQTLDYELSVPYGTTSLQLDAEPAGVGAQVNYYDGIGNPIPGGAVTFTGDGIDVEIIVTAFDGTELSYYVAIFVDPGLSDATLKDIELSLSALDPLFHMDTLEYTVFVPKGTSSIDVTGIPNYDGASITGNGTITLSGGTGTATLEVTSSDQSATRTYTVNVVEADGTNYALRLVGGDGNLSNIDISGFPLASHPYTIEMWFRPEGYQEYFTGLIYHRPNNIGIQYASNWQCGYVASLELVRFMSNPPPAHSENNYGTVTDHVDPDVWHHIAVVLTDSFRTVYLDGIQYLDKTGSPALDYSEGKLYIGWDSDADNRAFRGLIDEVRIWDDSLSAGFLDSNQLAVLNGDEPGLIGYWNFDLPASSTAVDVSATRKHGAITGGTYVPSFSRLDLDLDTLYVTNARMKPGFAPKRAEYWITLPKGTSSVTLNATASDPTTTLSGTGTKSISEPRGTFIVTVTSAGGEEYADYLVHYVVDTDLTLKHSYTFADGTAKDVVGGADGDIQGGSISEGVFSSSVEGDYILLPGGELALNTYPTITLEAYITSGVNEGYTMLAYFGGLQSANSIWIQPTRTSDASTFPDASRFELNTHGDMSSAHGMEAQPGENYHYVGVATHDSLYWYINGICVDTIATLENTIIAGIDTANGWLCYGGWNDPTWIGSLYEFNIYSGVMDAQTVQAHFVNWPVDGATKDATLSTLTVNGDTLDGFVSYKFHYDVDLPDGTTEVPVVVGTPTNANASVLVTNAEGIPDTTTVEVTAEDGVTKNTYSLYFYVFVSGVATLSDLTVDGVTVPDFDPEQLSYDIVLPKGTTEVPEVTATLTDTNATMVVNDAAGLPGSTTVEVTAQDGVSKNTYTLNFSVDATGIDAAASHRISVYPSVSRDYFTVTTGSGPSRISLYDLTGSLVSTVVTHRTETRVCAPVPGLYLLRIENGDRVETLKIIKTR